MPGNCGIYYLNAIIVMDSLSSGTVDKSSKLGATGMHCNIP
ncbi:MAG: hypothetical protein ACP5NK_04140 [Thermoplasmata archaeon]